MTTSNLYSEHPGAVISSSIVSLRKGGWTLTGPTCLVAPPGLPLGKVLEYAGSSIGPKGELPNGNDVNDVLDPDDDVDDEDEEYVLAKGPLGGDMPRASLKPMPAGKVDTVEEPLPAVIRGL